MKRHEQSLREFLDRSFARFRTLPPEHVESACDRVLDRLRKNPEVVSEFTSVPFHPVRPPWRVPRFAFAVLGVVVLLAVPFVRRFVSPQNVYAVVVAVNGSVDRVADGESHAVSAGEKIDTGKVLRTNGGAGLVFDLIGGSRVEMRADSEVVLETARDGILLQLNAGSIIVTAAKPRNGHLFVRTKDAMVSAVESVFLVGVEEKGSRVAVIRGEADVQQVATSRTLRPGEQIAANPLMESQAISEGIAWSRNAAVYLALLSQSSVRASEPLQFEVASIRPPVYPHTARVACRGIDGLLEQRTGVAPSATESVGYKGQVSEGPLVVPVGRCIGQPDFPSLVALAYNVPRFDVTGGPDWARGLRVSGMVRRFSIEAKAPDVSTVTQEELRQMLQSMLADRFKFKFHREPKEVDGYALLVAKNGLKLKEASGEIEVPHPGGYDPSRPITETVVKGKSPLKELAVYLMPFVSYGQTVFPVVDKTGLTAMYEYTLTLHQSVPSGAPRGGGGDIGGGFDPPVSRALEQQLGLTLQQLKVQSQAIVIDDVAIPTEN